MKHFLMVVLFCCLLLPAFVIPAGGDGAAPDRQKRRAPNADTNKNLVMPPEIFLLRRQLPPPSQEWLNELLAKAAATELPAAWDARLLGYVSPVKMQGACWVFSAIGTVESAIMKYNGGQVVDLSEQEITNCHPYGETGGMEYQAFAYILRRGIASESRYPWNPYDQQCHPPLPADYFINDYSILNVDFLPLAERRA